MRRVGGRATAANGEVVLYLEGSTSNGVAHVFAYDANGSQGCSKSGAATTCTPMWTYEVAGSLGAGAAVSVANGYAYDGGTNNVGSRQGTLFAFDQNGMTDCSAGVCSPVFETSGGPSFPSLASNLAVTSSTVFATTGSGTVAAFSASGCGQPNCTGALWSTGGICANNGSEAAPPPPMGSSMWESGAARTVRQGLSPSALRALRNGSRDRRTAGASMTHPRSRTACSISGVATGASTHIRRRREGAHDVCRVRRKARRRTTGHGPFSQSR